jgi:hypothetical protein
MNCPASIRQAEGIKEQKSEHAERGTAAHALAEMCLQRQADAETLIGTTVEGFEVDLDMVNGVQVYLDYVRGYLVGGGPSVIEHHFDLEPLKPPVPMFGTSDLLFLGNGIAHLHVFDYKNGYHLVEVEGNPQLQYYALGGLLWALNKWDVKPTTITLHIVQPNAPHPDGPCRSWTLTWNELVYFKRNLFERAKATLAIDAPLVVGSWCRWCKAAPTCPAQHKHALEVAQQDFGQVPAAEYMPLAQLTQVLEKAPIVEEWLNSVRAHVSSILEQGVEVPGWKLVPKRAVRKWADEDEAINFLKERRVPKKEYTIVKVVSPAQAEKVLKARLPRGKKKEAKDLLAPLVTAESSGYTLAPASDPRPGILKAADEFEALPEPTNSNPDTGTEEK